jgi:pyruvate dehydrogenase E2 component (dihydrolipoamide acetyltransferase)
MIAAPDAPVIVLLHGFGGEAAQWMPLMQALNGQGLSSVAFDLPGHAASLHYPDAGSAKVAAEAVIAALESMVEPSKPYHFAGHSFGGAVIALIALLRRDLAASLTFLAPGGFGPHINAAALQRFAAAMTRDELRDVTRPFYAPGTRIGRDALERLCRFRLQSGQTDMLVKIAAMITKPAATPEKQGTQDRPDSQGSQGTLPLEKLAALHIPSTVMWGAEDAIIPVSQAIALTGANVKILPGIGHTLYEEALDPVRDAIVERARR